MDIVGRLYKLRLYIPNCLSTFSGLGPGIDETMLMREAGLREVPSQRYLK